MTNRNTPVIVMAFNAAVQDAAVVMIHSLFKNGQLKDPYELHVFVDADVNKELFSEFDRVILRDVNMEDAGYETKKEGVLDADFMRGCSLSVYALDTLWRDGYDRAVWLDVDMFVLGEVDSLLRYDLGDFTFAACKDYHGDWNTVYAYDADRVFKEPAVNGDIYFNGGVFALDLRRFYRKCGLGEGGLYQVYLDEGSEFVYMDQCLFNRLVTRPLVLPKRYNMFIDWYAGWRVHREKKFTAHCTAPVSIVHFVGPFKPWIVAPENYSRLHRLQHRIGSYCDLVEEVSHLVSEEFRVAVLEKRI